MFRERLIKMCRVLLSLLLIDGLREEKTERYAGMGVGSRC
jgi:hypothetical protein